MTFVPDPGKIQDYQIGRRPCVEFDSLKGWVHATVIGWQGQMILVEDQPGLITKFTRGQRGVEWLARSDAARTRRSDSIYSSVEVGVKWLGSQDLVVCKRPDLWNSYKQKFPGPVVRHSSV